ncbi:MAG: phosphoribosylanthranilate isomerase [Methanosarcina sp.]|nr:phosphoribosylanthranilate isomerase [Methanosarcina sp.]MDD3317232.1 phosphoribosylanthranilate isomerase [Methanosarcina sp.]MDD4306493.1 phosphoribosylanthranilate isomerase [Methanosarcina sp.]MDD4620652.1 phosphoribosylanthranilate isomerase [Methanosarcina sp.]
MKLKIRTKICGIRSPEEIELAALYGADAVGFITEVPVESPRKLDSDTAAYLVTQVPKSLSSVLVIMPEDSDTAVELIEKIKPDIVQIHSKLPLLELEIIKEKTDIPIIKTLSVPVQGKVSGEKTENAAPVPSLLEMVRLLEEAGIVDSILLDTARPGKAGGTGCVHDWTLSRRISEETRLPLILAGGLKPENVRKAIRAVSPYAVDTASGVETRGKKDAVKIKSFIEEVRCASAFL